MDGLGARTPPAAFYLLPFTAFAIATGAFIWLSLEDLALLAAWLPVFVVYRHMCMELERSALHNRQPSFLTSTVKKYSLDVVFPILTTTLAVWRLSLPAGRVLLGGAVTWYLAVDTWVQDCRLPQLLGYLRVAVGGYTVFLFASSFWVRVPVGIFLVYQLFIKRNNPLRPVRTWATTAWTQHDRPAPDTTGLPAVYFLYVLGSGGHTAEMVETIKKQFQGQPNQHRRYVITSGDKDSLNHVERLEDLIKQTYPTGDGGTYDTFTIPRARRVHQSLVTSPFTCLVTAIQAVIALTLQPTSRPYENYCNQFKWPHVVVTNGPATGFIVCLVAHLLKMFYLVPANCLKMVYIESWARTKSLSLTGKLFLWTGIADVFCVQHEELARKIGAEHLGLVRTKPMPQTK